MAFSRYSRDRLTPDLKGFSTPKGIAKIRSGIATGQIGVVRYIISTQADRLDTLAGALYGDGRYWWILAAASFIGWGLQIPAGTVITVPDLKDVEKLLG
jgi:hypothetical protein